MNQGNAAGNHHAWEILHVLTILFPNTEPLSS